MKNAAVTFVYNESFNLPIWIRYFGGQFGTKNLFVVDGASFVSSGWQNPTMTILSLSMRASEYLAGEMNRQNI